MENKYFGKNCAYRLTVECSTEFPVELDVLIVGIKFNRLRLAIYILLQTK